MGFNCLKARATSRRQFTFYHYLLSEVTGLGLQLSYKKTPSQVIFCDFLYIYCLRRTNDF